jgi:hypothetical protein
MIQLNFSLFWGSLSFLFFSASMEIHENANSFFLLCHAMDFYFIIFSMGFVKIQIVQTQTSSTKSKLGQCWEFKLRVCFPRTGCFGVPRKTLEPNVVVLGKFRRGDRERG